MRNSRGLHQDLIGNGGSARFGEAKSAPGGKVSSRYVDSLKPWTDVTRLRTYTDSRGRPSFTNTDTSITFTLPNKHWVALNDIEFSCDATLTVTNGGGAASTNPRWVNGFGDAIFSEIRVKIGGQEVWRQLNNDRMSTLSTRLTSRRAQVEGHESINYHGYRPLETATDQGAARSALDLVTRRFRFPLGPVGSLLNKSGVLPAGELGVITIELYLNSVENVVCHGAGNVPTAVHDDTFSYTLDDCKLLYTEISSAALTEQFRRRGAWTLHCNGYDMRTSGEISAKDVSLDLESAHASLSQIVWFRHVEGSDYEDYRYDSMYPQTDAKLIESCNLYINGDRQYEDDLDEHDLFHETMTVMPVMKGCEYILYGGKDTTDEWFTNRQVIALATATDVSPDTRASIATNTNVNSLRLKYSCASTPSASYLVTAALVHDHIITLFKNGRVKVTK